MSADQAMILAAWLVALAWARYGKSFSIYSIGLTTTLFISFAGLTATFLWITQGE